MWKGKIMGYYKDKERKTYYVEVRYKDMYGNNKKKKKRGFKTAGEAKKWEAEFLNSLFSDPEITFLNLYKLYMEDVKTRCRLLTYINKEAVFKNHIVSFFENMKIKDITPPVVRKWQNSLLKKNFSQSYLKAVNTQLSSIFNYAVKFHNLKNNPVNITGKLGSNKTKNEMKIWTPKEFYKFIENVKNKEAEMAFYILFLTGMRVSEMLALTPEDIDFDKKIISISKSFQKISGKEIITPPKTTSSIRKIECPEFLLQKLKDYINLFYDIKKSQRIITITKATLKNYIRKYSKILGLEPIRIHDFRHSHASYLLSQNVNIVAISKRLGHESTKITLDVYSHILSDSSDYLNEVLNKIDFI